MYSIVVTTFYRLTPLENLPELSKAIKSFMTDNSLLGTIILAQEGINATISGSRESINKFYEFIDQYDSFKNLFFKESFAREEPFDKIKVKLKKEVVAMGVKTNSTPGDYIAPDDWDATMEQKDVVVIDTRNDYEWSVGTFENAIVPDIENFREFPAWFDANIDKFRDKKIIMFCTAGIRVEKVSCYVKDLGHNEVYQLEGGIQHYLQQTGNINNKWKGKCFTFDNRVIVDDYLES